MELRVLLFFWYRSGTFFSRSMAAAKCGTMKGDELGPMNRYSQDLEEWTPLSGLLCCKAGVRLRPCLLLLYLSVVKLVRSVFSMFLCHGCLEYDKISGSISSEEELCICILRNFQRV